VCMIFILLSCTQGESDSKYSKANPDQLDNQNQSEKNLDEDQITAPPKKKEELVPEAEKETTTKEDNIKVTFVELGSKGCVPCDMMQPIMEEIKEEYPSQVKVIFHDSKNQRWLCICSAIQDPRHSHTRFFSIATGMNTSVMKVFFPKKKC